MQNRLAARSFAVLAGTALISLSAATVATAAPAPAPELAGTPSATSALATAAAGPDFSKCRMFTAQHGATCFQWVGDTQWVLDSDPNGWTTVVHVQTNYGKDRYCNAQPAAEGWGYCNFDHTEGKCVRFKLYETKGGDTQGETGWSPWYGTEYGSPC